MFRSIRTGLSLTFGLLILIGLLATGTTLWIARNQAADALVINLAGRERMLSQRVAKLALMGVQHRQDASSLVQMHAAAREWETIFHALRDGGEITYEGRKVTLSPTTAPLLRAQLERVWSLWQPFRLATQVVLEYPPDSPAFVQGLADVEALSESLLTEIERAVQLYETAATARVARLEQIQLAFLIASALGVALGVGLIRWQIIRPLEVLRMAVERMGAGNLSTPVPQVAQNEIGTVAAACDALRQRVVAAHTELEQWTAKLEHCVTARTREIATLSMMVQTANRHTEIEPLLAETLPLLCETIGCSSAWVVLREAEGTFRLAGAHNLPPALQADDGAEMHWLGCTCQRRLLAGELTAAVNVLECERLQTARGDTRGLRYHASLPLRVRDRTLGLLNLITPPDRIFSDDELRLLGAISDQMAIAIERAQMHERIKTHHIEEQAALLKLSQALLGETEAQAIMDRAVRAAGESLGVELAMLVLIDADGQTFSAQAGIGWPPAMLSQLQRLPLDTHTGLGHAIRTGVPVVIPDESRETRFGTLPWVQQMGLVSSLFVPMFSAGQVIGGMVVNSRTLRAWSEHEVQLLALIANTTALALERAQQYATALKRLQRITALHAIDLAITANLNLEQRLNVLLEKVTAELHLDAAAIALSEPETHNLVYVARRGLDGEFFSDDVLRLPESVVARVAHSGEVIAIADARTDARLVRRASAQALGLVAYLAVPLRVPGEIIGVLELATRRPHPFGQEEIDFFVTLAGQAAIAIENARLYQETTQRLCELELLHRAMLAITQTPHLDAALDQVVGLLADELEYPHVAIILVDPAGEGVAVYAQRGIPQAQSSPATQSLRFGQGLVGWVVQHGQPLLVNDVSQDPRYVVDVPEARAALVVPLRVGERTIGVIQVTSPRVNAFGANDLRLLSTLAGQVASAIERAQLFEETRRRALEQSTVSEIARALNAALDVRQAFPAIVQGLRALTPCDRVSLALVDESREYFTITALDEPRPELAQGTRLPLTATSAAAEVLAGRPHLTPDLSAEANYPAESALYQAGHRARVNVPLIVGERVIGSLNLTSRQLGAFTTAHLPVLQQIASAIAIAIENTHLFHAEQRRRQELGALYDLSRALAEAAYDFDAILNLVARHAVESVVVTFARVAVQEGEEFIIRAAYPLRLLARDLEVGRRERVAAHPFCQRVLAQNTPLVLRADSPEITAYERETLFLGLAQTLCLVPLRAGERAFGLLMLGEMRRETRAPFTPDKIHLARSIGDQAASALHRAELYVELERAYLQTVLALANAIDAKDTYTADHAQRLAQMALAVGRALGLSARELEDLRYGAILHDVGKIGVSDAILKKPGQLDAAEWQEMRQHPVIGARILAPVPRLAGAARIVRHHHERYDGTGYPDGLAGEAIPLGARILSVVDAYSAIVDARVYKAARSHAEAVAELKKHAGTQFDPQVVKVFLQVLSEE